MKLVLSFSKIAIFVMAAVFAFNVKSSEPKTDPDLYWMKIKTKDRFDRTRLANLGFSIELVREDYIVVIGSKEDLDKAQSTGQLEVSFKIDNLRDFPTQDAEYHNYAELTSDLQKLHADYPTLTTLGSIGKSNEGRDLWAVHISGKINQLDQLPGIIFMGGHHAREHLSVEVPLRHLKYLLSEYQKGNARIVQLMDSRDITYIPAVNPDGLEYDVSTGSYKAWRKNRSKNANGTYGVDLNRNYGFGWGTGGSSSSPSSDVYMGPTAFSEPETQAIKRYVESQKNVTMILTFHTFSELILYPWGGQENSISNQKDRQVFETMGKKMASWNNYKPEQASQLYIASGDTCDWAYGSQKIFCFTFELDPQNTGFGVGGFYPGVAIIDSVVQKNLEPVLYMMNYADNPYRVLESSNVRTQPAPEWTKSNLLIK